MRYSIMFSSAGVGELLLEETGFNCVVANELIEKRADFHSHVFTESTMILGDILDKNIFDEFIQKSKESEIDLLIATPPCQGFSLAGKHRATKDMIKDDRNFLVFKVFEAIREIKPKYVLIENVPKFANMYFPYNNELMGLIDIINNEFGSEYHVESKILNSANYGVPQNRKRSIIKLYSKDVSWPWPIENEGVLSVREAIGYLPSIESGEESGLKWHFGRRHVDKHIEIMKNTPSGKSAFNNEVFFPKNNKGERIKGFSRTYSRMAWDVPAPTITTRNDAISSQINVHPGYKMRNGLYSDARVLSILELMILSSIPLDWRIPDWASEMLIRKVIGESVPPLLIKKIVGELK